MNKEEIIRQWAEKNMGAAYVYGGTGRRCTPEYRRECMAQYPTHKAAIEASCPVLSRTQDNCRGCRYEGKACFDCAQFTRRALEAAGMSIPSGASSQWRSDSWHRKGGIADMPRDRVCVLFRASGDNAFPMAHTGIYLGNGQSIDARSHAQGVRLGPVTAYPWTHYAIPHGLADGAIPLIAQGERSGRVKTLQALLIACGYSLPRYGADGAFGAETLKALNTFQRENGLPEVPHADDTTMALLQDMAAKTAPETTDALLRRVQALESRLAACKSCPQKVGAGA